MKKRSWLLIVGSIILLFGCQASNPVFGKYKKSDLEKRIHYIGNLTRKSIVTIEVVKEYYLGGKRQKTMSGGSGSIISSDGLVLTNYHVAGDAKRILVTLWNKKRIPAEIVGEDPLTDLAVLRLRPDKLKNIQLEPIKFGDYEKISDGDFVLALGSPYLLSQTVTLGMVANKKRLLRVEFEGSGEQTQAEHPITIWIHHTAPIYGGNSGGPLVNLDGEQIGVNTRALFGTSQSFAVAIDVVKDVVSRILKYGRPMWAYYGWKLTELNDELKEFLKLPENFEGVFISDVVYGSPAYNAGIRGEDFLLSVDGIRVSATIKEEIPPILRMLAKKEINKPVEVVIRKKDGQILHTKVIPEDYELWEIPLMAELPGFQREKDFYASEIYGFSVQKITKKVAVKERLEVPWGVFCTGVQTGSIAANSGLSAQDIIKYIDNQPITDFDTFKKIIEQYEKNRPEKITLTVQRGNSKTYVIFRDVEKLLKSKEEKR